MEWRNQRPGRVADLEAKADSSTRRVSLSWQGAPNDPVEPSKYFVIKFREESGRWKWIDTVFVPARQRWYEVALREPGHYRFHVGALAPCGAGTPTQVELLVQPEDLHEKPPGRTVAVAGPPSPVRNSSRAADHRDAAADNGATGALQQAVSSSTSDGHIVQLYRDSGALARTVSSWAGASLGEGSGALLLATPEHASLVLGQLRAEGHDVATLQAAGRLKVVDARGCLASFMSGGMPDAAAFRRAVAAPLAQVRATCRNRRARVGVWGEMVNMLRREGNAEGAHRLEALWNEVIEAEGIRLLCSYHADHLAPDTHENLLPDVCLTHSRLVPDEHADKLDVAVDRALVDVFGKVEAEKARARYAGREQARISMPSAQSLLLSIHETEPALGRRMLDRTREHLRALGVA